jgi:GxxExxY protein
VEQEDTRARALFGDRSHQVIGACIEVHRHLGPGLLESVYEASLCHELGLRGIAFERQRRIPLIYKGVALDSGFIIDVLVEDRIMVEVKAVEHILAVHKAQVITYLRLAAIDTGLLVNFNAPTLVHGLRRFVRGRDYRVDAELSRDRP